MQSYLVFLHKRLFPGLEPVTFQSRDNNFTVAPRLPLVIFYYFFLKLVIRSMDWQIRGPIPHPLAGGPIKVRVLYGLARRNWHQEDSNLRPWDEHTPKSQVCTTRPTRVGCDFLLLIMNASWIFSYLFNFTLSMCSQYYSCNLSKKYQIAAVEIWGLTHPYKTG